MLALTLWQPWAAAIVHCGKRIENRTWRPPSKAIGQLIALHAGLARKPGAWTWPEDVPWPTTALTPRGAIVGVARLVGVVEGLQWAELPDDQLKWWAGPIAWRLAEVRALDPVVWCKGRQGLWKLTDDVAETVEARL